MSDNDGAAPAAEIATVAGTVAILGRPNVGKSTLLNRIVGEKLAIVSPKPQTTRNRIVGVWNGTIALRDGGKPVKGQIVFVDTPGVHPPHSELSRFMVREAFGAVEGVDAVVVMIEAPNRPAPAKGLPRGAASLPEAERKIIDRVKQAGVPAVLAVNKVDLLKEKSLLLPLIEAWSEREPFKAIVPISATEGVGVVELVRELLGLLPEGPPLYDEETITDRSERFLAGELIREQLFLRLRNELPYASAVIIDNWEERPQGDVVIDATILVERDSQKGIIVGKGGQMIRDVGTSSREEIAKLLGRPAHLRLHAKVAPDWTTSPESIARLGYERQDD
jgi:GTP-binding protein Era